MSFNLTLSFSLILITLASAYASDQYVDIESIVDIEVEVSPVERVCLPEFPMTFEGPCNGRKDEKFKLKKTATAKVRLKDGTTSILGSSTVSKIGVKEDLEFKNPLANLQEELSRLKTQADIIYFNQYNLCYKTGISSNKLDLDKRVGGSRYHLKTSRIYVECDPYRIPAMVFAKD